MSDQLDMFAPAPAKPKGGDVCGRCVVWNGTWTAGEYGAPNNPEAWCTRMGLRKAADAACDQFFGKHELHRPLYGRKR